MLALSETLFFFLAINYISLQSLFILIDKKTKFKENKFHPQNRDRWYCILATNSIFQKKIQVKTRGVTKRENSYKKNDENVIRLETYFFIILGFQALTSFYDSKSHILQAS